MKSVFNKRFCACLLLVALFVSLFSLTACSDEDKGDKKSVSEKVEKKKPYEGTWLFESKLDSGEKMKIYYTIEERNSKCYFEASYGTAYYPGVYKENPDGAKNTLYFKLDYQAFVDKQYDTTELLFNDCLNGSYKYTLDGKRGSDSYTMTLIDDSDKKIVLKYAQKPELTDYVKLYDDFKADKRLLGEWEVDNSMYDMDPTIVTFNEDGTMAIDNYGIYVTEFVYSATDGFIKMAGFGNEKVEQELDYSFKEGALVMGGIKFYRIGKTPKSNSTPDQL